ncbi:MAG: hypothetical protein ACP5I8_09660 [Phycisphaerae bacterium]
MANPISQRQTGPQSFSTGVDKLLDIIRPYGRSETHFPAQLNNAGPRQMTGENLHAWFVRLVDQCCDGNPAIAGIEGNIAILATLKWKEDRLVYASVQALVAEQTLEDYYLDGAGHATYLRMDLSYEKLGNPFSHPLPHIHVGGDESTRFSLDGGSSGNVIMDFLEFIYRNHAPQKWLDWARDQWLSKHGGGDQHGGKFDRIVNAFREGQFPVLRDNLPLIRQIKQELRRAKDSLFKSHMDGADREIMEYPLAR